MLFLTRKIGETIIINDDISITVIQISGRTVKLGINYPKHVRVYRQEIYDRIQAENKLASQQVDLVHRVLQETPSFQESSPCQTLDEANESET